MKWVLLLALRILLQSSPFPFWASASVEFHEKTKKLDIKWLEAEGLESSRKS